MNFSVFDLIDTTEAESVSESIKRMDEADEIAYLLSLDFSEVKMMESIMRDQGFEC